MEELRNYADCLIKLLNCCKIVLKYQRIFFPLSSLNFMLGLFIRVPPSQSLQPAAQKPWYVRFYEDFNNDFSLGFCFCSSRQLRCSVYLCLEHWVHLTNSLPEGSGVVSKLMEEILDDIMPVTSQTKVLQYLMYHNMDSFDCHLIVCYHSLFSKSDECTVIVTKNGCLLNIMQLLFLHI